MRYYLSSLLVSQLRDYGYPEQWGLEPTFQLYLEHLWSMMDEVCRVLKPEGTCWINLGDTYHTHGCGSKKSTHNFQSAGIATKNGIGTIKKPLSDLPEKCLLLIPHRFAIGCIDPDYELRDDLTDEELLFVIKELKKYGL